MKPSEMTPGVYRLTAPVINPIVDKRHRHDWRLVTPTFNAGQEFIAEAHLFPFKDEQDLTAKIKALDLVAKSSRFEHQSLVVWTHDDEISDARLKRDKKALLLAALLPHLERVGDYSRPLGKAAQAALLKEAMVTIAAGKLDQAGMVELAKATLQRISV